MKLAVFGATGGLGRAVTRAALDAGHEVRAMVRDPSKLAVDGVEVVVGDLADAAAIASTIAGTDAVVSCVGVVKGGDPEVFGAGMKAIVDAMTTHSVGRLVAISGAGLELDDDVTGLGRRMIIAALKLFARDVLRGKELEWAAIRDSGVDWTLVRVARMVDRPAAGNVAVDARQVSGSPMVAYADVAQWMVAEVGAKAFVGQAPFVSGG